MRPSPGTSPLSPCACVTDPPVLCRGKERRRTPLNPDPATLLSDSSFHSELEANTRQLSFIVFTLIPSYLQTLRARRMLRSRCEGAAAKELGVSRDNKKHGHATAADMILT
ncbi:hypothetical protein DNTS_007857 [Danionella cerebrum]|uniref:Uncharacterized protein n=1 Tax=Danionella cerebrum TaxID=2873325 RepID=A0A553RG21_9TELE|nr:hypothetical protein DNTS_007857 [Danionella translucida]